MGRKHDQMAEVIRLLKTLVAGQGGGLASNPAALQALTLEIEKMAGELDALTAAVAQETAVDASAIALLQGLKAQLDAAIASGNPAALTALSASIGANSIALAAAVAANTPAAP